MTGDSGGRKRRRLSRSGDLSRVYREGSSNANRYLVLYSFPRPEADTDGARLGVSVGRKVGGAVERNRVKRVIREAFWSLGEKLPEGHDFVVIARAELAKVADTEGADGVRSRIEEVLGTEPEPDEPQGRFT